MVVILCYIWFSGGGLAAFRGWRLKIFVENFIGTAVVEVEVGGAMVVIRLLSNTFGTVVVLVQPANP